MTYPKDREMQDLNTTLEQYARLHKLGNHRIWQFSFRYIEIGECMPFLKSCISLTLVFELCQLYLGCRTCAVFSMHVHTLIVDKMYAVLCAATVTLKGVERRPLHYG